MKNNIYSLKWNLAIRKKTNTIISDQTSVFSIINNPYGYWAADPFLYKYNNKTYIFAELWSYFTGKGVIGCAEYNQNTNIKWKIIINEPWHLSYPLVFKHKNEIYLLPEFNAGNKLCLYKAKNFPYEWENYNIILDNVRYIDTTLYRTNNEYICVAQEYDKFKSIAFVLNDNLQFERKIDYIGHNDNVSRPGGKFLLYNNDIISVCQNCQKYYGEGLYFYKTVIHKNTIKVNENILYIDKNNIKLNKNKDILGVHTYNSNENYEIIDILSYDKSLLALFSRLLLKIKSLKKK